jgi:ABC-2 type transport system permease protein
VTLAVRAEWTKLRTLPSTGWLLVAAVSVTVAVSAVITAVFHVNSGSPQDPTKLSLAGVQIGQALIVILAVLAVSEEYGTGMIRVTLTAIPHRLTLLVAKAANLAGLTLLVGLIGVAGCLLTGRLILPGAGIDQAHGYELISLSHSPTMRAAAGSVLYSSSSAYSASASPPPSATPPHQSGAVLGLLYLPPIAAQLVADPTWRRHLEQIAPMTAGLAIQATTNLRSQPIAPWAGLGVLAVWAAALSSPPDSCCGCTTRDPHQPEPRKKLQPRGN